MIFLFKSHVFIIVSDSLWKKIKPKKINKRTNMGTYSKEN